MAQGIEVYSWSGLETGLQHGLTTLESSKLEAGASAFANAVVHPGVIKIGSGGCEEAFCREGSGRGPFCRSVVFDEEEMFMLCLLDDSCCS